MPSLLRGFSAPVKLDAGYNDDDLALLMAHDSDAFTRWDAGQRLAGNVLLALVRDHAEGSAARARSIRGWSPPFAASLERAPRIRPSPRAPCRCPAAAISASRWR